MNGMKLAVALILLLAAGGLVYGLVTADDPVLPPADTTPVETGDPAPKLPAPKEAAEAPTTPPPAEVKRTAIGPGGQAKKGAAKLDHGLQGVVVNQFGQPLEGVKVYLAQSFEARDFFQSLAMTRNMPTRNYNVVRTDKEGVFLIAYPQALRADLFISHPGYQVVHRAKQHVPNKEIQSLGTIELKPGFVIQGHVRAADSGTPIAGATVRINRQGTQAFNSVPGQEDGIDRTTDDQGYYKFDSLPLGSVNMEAFARGFAKQVIQNTPIAADTGPKQVDFTLRSGSYIAGVVVDGAGKPIPGAKVEAISHSPKVRASSMARSGAEGAFEVLGLPEGAYRLTAQAQGYVDGVKPMAKTGQDQVAIILQQQSAVNVRVLGRNGRPLRAFFLELRSVAPNQSVYGRTNVPAQNVRNARGGRYRLKGVDPGKQYALRVEAKHYAMTFSEPFQVDLGQPEPEITVRMNEGGTITGRVVDSTGKPVAGAKVHTMTHSYQDNPFTAMLGALIPVTHTRTHAVTKADGTFQLRTIMPEKYQLKVVHPDYPKTYKKTFTVKEKQNTDAGDIRLPIGVVVCGHAFDDKGKPIVLGKVTMQSVGKAGFGGEAVTNDKGWFAFPAAPPGTYKVSCGRVDGNQPFLILLDHKKSETTINVTGTQKKHQIRLQIR